MNAPPVPGSNLLHWLPGRLSVRVSLILTICCTLFCLSGCQNDEVMFEVSSKFIVYQAMSCNCKALYLIDEEGKKALLAENVTALMGNQERFLVQTTEPRVHTVTWVLIDRLGTTAETPLVPLTDNEVEALLEQLKLDFAKTFQE